MDESMIQKITRETVNKLKNRKDSYREVLLIFMGGDREVDTALGQIKCLSRLNINFSAYLTKAAQKVIGTEKVLNSGVKAVVSDEEIWGRGILDRVEAVIVPVLTLNGASKIAGMIADSASSNIILLALRCGKKMLMARDSVICCGGPQLPVTSMYMKKVNEIINTIKSLGAKVTVANNLAREAAELLNLDKRLVPLDSPPPGAPCGGNIDECTECGLCVINREGDVKAIIDAGAARISSKQVGGEVPGDMAPFIDHTNLKADATQEQIGKLCEEAKEYNFATVCINPGNVKFAKQLLEGSPVRVTTVTGFPLGATTSTVKAIEARDAMANGADEIDMVINVGALKSGNYQLVEDDVKAVREATRGKILKVILETALLNKEQIVEACRIAKAVGADFVKTSTGFGPGGATAEDVRLMRETVGPLMGVKASGGIRTGEDAKNMIEAGATRIGASASVAIVTGSKTESTY